MTTTYTDAQIELALDTKLGLEHTLRQLIRGDTVAVGYAKTDVVRALLDALAERKAAIQHQGGAAVPARFLIDKGAWEAAQFAFGGPGTGEGEEFMDCTAWVGDIENDEGSKTHGLHIECNECPEEGSITLAEFDPPQPPQHVNGDGGDARGDFTSLLNYLDSQAEHPRDQFGNGSNKPNPTLKAWYSEQARLVRALAETPVQSVSDADVEVAKAAAMTIKHNKESWFPCTDRRLRAALEAFLKGGEGHE